MKNIVSIPHCTIIHTLSGVSMLKKDWYTFAPFHDYQKNIKKDSHIYYVPYIVFFSFKKKYVS